MPGIPCALCGRTEARPFLRRPGMRVLRCRCGLAFAAPDTPVEPYDPGYFEKWGPGQAPLVAMKKKTYRAVLARVPRGGIRRVLDIGCALGWSLDAAREDGFETAGVEVDESVVRKVAERHRVLRDSALFEDAAFDLVTLVDVIEHVRDPLGMLREARRLLRPGGWAVLTTPDLSSLSARLMGPRWPHFIPEHVVYFDRESIRRVVRSAGLQPLRVESFRKALRADYIACLLGARGDRLGRAGAALARPFGGLELALGSGDMCVVARRPVSGA